MPIVLLTEKIVLWMNQFPAEKEQEFGCSVFVLQVNISQEIVNVSLS